MKVNTKPSGYTPKTYEEMRNFILGTHSKRVGKKSPVSKLSPDEVKNIFEFVGKKEYWWSNEKKDGTKTYAVMRLPGS